MLKVRDLHFRHKEGSIDVLKGISFNAPRGTITSILGPNGSGKTTLFKCISGLWKAQKGEITFDEKPVTRLSPKARAKIFSIVFQDHQPSFPFSVIDVVLLGRTSYIGVFSVPSLKDYEIASSAISTVGIESLRDTPYTQISGGERQLTLIARALAQDAPCMLLDEPTSHLDFRNQIEILKKVRELALRKNLAVLITLHDPNLAMLFSDRVIVINSGMKVAEGNPKEVINEEMMKRVYKIDVNIISSGENKMVYPRT
ncbi:MAG: ABC transporter ATP-binding protein [Deltaproteobacteria bacterium]|nr:ABC transporter ATP-binding protein [Deltaproteobacteria bacterium]